MFKLKASEELMLLPVEEMVISSSKIKLEVEKVVAEVQTVFPPHFPRLMRVQHLLNRQKGE